MMPRPDYTSVRGEESGTEVRVMGLKSYEVEDNTLDQLEGAADAGWAQGDIRVMPDCHVGAGCTIGFTMTMDNDPFRVCPNTVGVDVGCGMLAVEMGNVGPLDEQILSDIDRNIREAVPMGRDVHQRNDYHMGEDFPWSECQEKLDRLLARLDLDLPEWFEGYGLESYFKPLISRLDDVDEEDEDSYMGYVINSMGTLGGGNHFVELCQDEEMRNWLVLHSGSRNIGKTIAEHHQDRATRLRTNEWIQELLPEELEPYVVPDLDDPELADWFMGGKGKSYIDSEAIKANVNDNYLIGFLHDQIRTAHPQERDVGESLDYLEGQEAVPYLIDMIFAQTYAWENRKQMVSQIQDELGFEINQEVHSPHNMIDFSDLVLRKGATRAHEGEQFVLPFNMAAGTYICEGKGNDLWNRSGPHGAGRVMSRTQAENEIEMDEFEEEMRGVYSSSVVEDTLDEAPQAYKPAEMIQEAIDPTADVVHKLDPVINIKALD